MHACRHAQRDIYNSQNGSENGPLGEAWGGPQTGMVLTLAHRATLEGYA